MEHARLDRLQTTLDERDVQRENRQSYFAAYPYLRANDTGYNGEICVGDSVQGTIRFTFKGDLDTYHSDDLDMSTTTQTWLRTGGLGNNSMNIGYASDGQSRPAVGAGIIAVGSALSLLAALV